MEEPGPDELRDMRRMLYDEQVRMLRQARHQSFVSFDQAILSLSSGALVLSLAFISDVVPLDLAERAGLLRYSWALFAGAILCTLASFVTSRRAISRQLRLAGEYYLEEREGARDEPNRWNLITEVLNGMAGLTFLAALGLTVAFVWINT